MAAKLSPNRLKLADYCRSVYFTYVDNGVTLKDILSPEFWTNSGQVLVQGDRIEIFSESCLFWGEFLVMDNTNKVLRLAKLQFVDFNDGIALVERSPGFEVKWGGNTDLFRVIRVSDGFVVKSGLKTKISAFQWIEDYEKALTKKHLGVPLATKLGVYNAALRALGELKLSSLAENREPRRVLDDIWDDGFINQLLEMGHWKFANRTVKLTYTPSVNVEFGYAYAFDKPEDFVHIGKVCTDEYLNNPLLDYNDEGSMFFSDLTEIYIQYVSNGASYGSDLSKWPESFSSFAGFQLALDSCTRLTQNSSKYETLFKLTGKAKLLAKSKDAIKSPTQFLPTGTWVSSRGGRLGNGGRKDRGLRGSLIQ